MLIKQKKVLLTPLEREGMRAAGRFNAQLMDFVRPFVREGVTTGEIDKLVHDYTRDHGHIPACLGYGPPKNPFPRSCCTSINQVVCHGIPNHYALRPGDIINLDLTTIVDGWHGDQSETFIIEPVPNEVRRVVQCAFDSLHLAIQALSPGCCLDLIGQVIVKHAAKFGFGVVDKYVGHGIGRRFHQPPNVSHVPTVEAKRQRIEPGLCFTIEPMINGGTKKTVEDPRDGWTVRTADGKVSAQFEHTLLMGENGVEILTTTEHGPQPGHLF
jgi:methionyl aminopeptidase